MSLTKEATVYEALWTGCELFYTYDGQANYRHYEGLGDTCGKMIVSVCTPVLNIMDAIWVSHADLAGYPASATSRSNQLLASQDPVALDYWAAKYVLYPIDKNSRHHPSSSGIDNWLVTSRDIINARGGIASPSKGIIVNLVTKSEAEMRLMSRRVTLASASDFMGSWSGDGVYSRNSETGAWALLASPAKWVHAGDLDGDGLDDLLGIWGAQNEVWVKSSSTGAWKKIATGARCISSGDMNGDGRADFLGSWDDQGVFYQDSKTGLWFKIAKQAFQVMAADLDGDGQDDLIGIWPEQGGVWVKYSRSSEWEKIASIADWIAAGDMNGDGRTDFVGSWGDMGIFYRDSVSRKWFKIATPGTAIATGDLDGDGKDDLVGIWPGQGGVWVRYSGDGSWERLSSIPDALTTGRIRPTAKPLAQGPFLLASSPLMPGDAGIGTLSNDQSAQGPGGWRFVWQEEKNLVPQSLELWNKTRIPGPGEPGFVWTDWQNLSPQERAPEKKPKKTTFDKPAGPRLKDQ